MPPDHGALRLSPMATYRLRRVESPRVTPDTSSSTLLSTASTKQATSGKLNSEGKHKISRSSASSRDTCEAGSPLVRGTSPVKSILQLPIPSISASAGSRKKTTSCDEVTSSPKSEDVLLGQPATFSHKSSTSSSSSINASRAVESSAISQLDFGDQEGSKSMTKDIAESAHDLKYIFPENACIIPGRLYWAVDVCNRYSGGIPSSTQQQPHMNKFHFFSTDSDFIYDAFYADFGPLNLGQTWRYCEKLQGLLKSRKLKHKVIVHYCSSDPCKKANSAYLITAFSVICLKKSPSEAFLPFEVHRRNFLPFRDATYGICTYPLRIIDCLKGLYQAIKLGWFSYESFDIEQYEHYEKILNGDLNWIVPNKFIAFSGPVYNPSGADNESNCIGLTPQSYIPIFKKLGVTLVVRLNKKQYCRKYFLRAGINHVDLYFLDGSCPSKEIIYKFISLCEAEPGAIAVHCKAGLGRTGTVIGCYAMKHYGFNANEWIGWNRICRPGSVLGPQQIFLHEIQKELQAKPAPSLALTTKTTIPRPGTHEAQGLMTPLDRRVAERGDFGQGERLVSAKRQAKASELEESLGDGSPTHEDSRSNATFISELAASPLARKASPTRDKDFLFRKKTDDGGSNMAIPELVPPLYAARPRSAHRYTPTRIHRHPNVSPTMDV